jgi:hypothetical protein
MTETASGPADWLRTKRNGQPLAAPPSAEDQQLAAQDAEITRQLKQEQIETKRDEIDRLRAARERSARLRDLREERELEALSGGGGQSKDAAAVETLRQITQGMADERKELLRTLQDKDEALLKLQGQMYGFMADSQKAEIQALRQDVQAIRSPSSTDPIDLLVKSAESFVTVRQAMERVFPSQPSATEIQVNSQLSGREQLEQLRIAGEIEVRKLIEQGKLEEAREQRATNARDYELRKSRVDGTFEALQSLAGPALSAWLGDKVGGIIGGGDAAPAPPTLSVVPGGAAPAAIGGGGMYSFLCPACKSTQITVPVTATSAVCPNPACREILTRPGATPQAVAPPPGTSWNDI